MITCKFNVVNEDFTWFLSAVYAECGRNERKGLWWELAVVRSMCDGQWVVCGNFNVTRYPIERIDCQGITRAMSGFSDWINDMELIDPPFHGAKVLKRLDKLRRLPVKWQATKKEDGKGSYLVDWEKESLSHEVLQNVKLSHSFQDIEIGKPVRPQLALRVSNASAAWKKLHGKEVVVECKFDGDRIQIHKNNSELNFFSRNFLDHQEYAHGMSDVITQNILADKCILDGEMLVWDASINRFAEFGSNQEIDVAFDILYFGDTSVIHRSLKERQEILRKVVKPITGRLEILVPDGGLNAHRLSGKDASVAL
ncbi:hypothetical protein FXO37_29319 [Capsicum annuum]|nr:hypothetical protein FXO37_29319 [Capsicum annuum]